MSRPTTRSKNKRHRPEDNLGLSSETLRKIYATKEISQDDIRLLYSISKPICQGCRANSKDSPNCFCGLIPPPNGSRKCGLWQRVSDVLQELGPDPCLDLRSSSDYPAGLTNLGATCYANSILQCLYMNTSFREGIYSVERELLRKQPVLDQLARLFAHLHSSKMAFIDSAPFIKMLELDNGSQQDSHEFFTLFLSLLEQSLSHSNALRAKTVVQDLFRGNISHVTRCSVCGKESEASSKMEDFYELELNIKGLKTLDESLDDYFSVEELEGDNQYFCESCRRRVDATRSIKLHKLPPILNFQLKRCVFLPKTTTKKKLTSMFSFPRVLDMAQRVCDAPEMTLMYDLSAILIHKGTAVNSGHYVAHIKDEYSGHWWEFDDEHVTKLGLHPFGEGSASSMKTEQAVQSASSELAGSVNNGNSSDASSFPLLDSKIINNKEIFSSADAYMLMYKKKCAKESDVVELDMDRCSKNFLPSHLSEEIESSNAAYVGACEEYKLKKEKKVGIIMERRHEVRSLVSELPVQSFDDPFFWVSTEWLRQWSDSVTPPSIDNASIQCSHGKVPVSKVGSMKRISEIGWRKLVSKYGGGPELSSDDYCIDCLEDVAKITVSADSYRLRRLSMREIADTALAGHCDDESLYCVSRAWLLQWVRRKNVDSPCDADVGPTASLQCPHGGLMPEQAPGAKRVLVPERLWLFLVESAKVVKPNDSSGCLAFPVGSEPCTVCCQELAEMASIEDIVRATRVKQRQNHERLFMGKSIALNPGCRYYLLPSSWLTKWRAYVTTNGKHVCSAEPENLEVLMDSLKCEEHMLLLERHPELVWKRGAIVQKTSSMDGLTIINETDWKLFCEEWNVPEEKGIYADIDFPSWPTAKLASCTVEMPMLDSGMPSDEVDAENESRLPTIRTHPATCEICVGERESCELMQKLNYCDEDIRVFLVQSGKVAPRSVIEAASGAQFELDRRASKRSRRTSGGNSINLKVSGSTSVYQLKMMLWEYFGIVKENQKLHKGSRVVEGSESATLADINIFPGDVLWVTDMEIHENRDIADEISEQKIGLHEAEEGFRGTLLTSHALPQEQ